MVGLLLWLVVGAVVGWLASIIMRDNNGLLMDIVVGIVGAFVGGLIFGRGTINDGVLTLNTFLVSLVGAVILLAIVNLVRRNSLR
ncbi:MAG TPA: GlsB/YeaQ/YmgE family stress response membrane protein [Sphingomonas sp.]